MAGSPQYKVYTPQNYYTAACKHPEEAAALMSFLGEGATIRLGHTKSAIVWHEGHEEIPASESYDRVAEIVLERVEQNAVR